MRKSTQLASQHRKHVSIAGRLTGLVISSHISQLRSMTPIERHAELIYAEALVQKALLGIIYSGDWLHFIKEALNMRSAMNTYQHMYEFMVDADANAEGGHDDSLDAHWRSGVLLGTGVSNLVLSLLPGRVISIAELFGYKGDRKTGLDLLMRAGGWTKDSSEPTVSIAEEGLRRSLCDMTLIIFHLVLSAFTFTGVDLEMAEAILNWNLKRYPTGTSCPPHLPWNFVSLTHRPYSQASSGCTGKAASYFTKPNQRSRLRPSAVPSSRSRSTFPSTTSAPGKSQWRTSRSCKSPNHSSAGAVWWPMRHGAKRCIHMPCPHAS